MCRSELSNGMILHAWTSLWGEFLITVKEVIPSKPSRVRGTIIKVLKNGDGFRRGILLDPFMGSGTTAIKARKMNRDFIGFELNPEYCSIAEKRLAQKVLIDFFDTNQEAEV